MASYHQQQGGSTFMAIPTINFQVCPICADNLDKDTDEHFRVQHSHLLKVEYSISHCFHSDFTATSAMIRHCNLQTTLELL
ncbi:hypothetical protein OsI_18145 [Oryza sativa Indica Group]|uniref:Drought induced 19 protein type zinc-binding domain-containing protein n=1 Tax=Oryza sativa subsp. indica TaxID=39946 RepID=A2XZI7_ORYSI|nr:hypothetical protein OsI_18145 [Oryza sativa Indica Group]